MPPEVDSRMTTNEVKPHGRRSLLALLRQQGVAVRSDCGGHGMCGKCRVRVRDGSGSRYVLACQFIPEGAVRVELGESPATRRPSIEPRRVDPDLVLAVDFGTTTISMAAVDLKRRRVRSRRDVLNPQVVFGSDVMTRISRARQVRRVRALEPVLEFMRRAGVSRRRAAVVVGNTTMVHFLLGLSPAGLGRYPYRSRVPLGRAVSGRTALQPSLRVRVPPLLGSFVGADCTAAILASGIHRARGLGLLVDAGTNGEVVFGNRERILVCSTAAGPAFEGATLECGSLACPGAVRTVRPARNGFQVETIGNRPAQSICGSGVLSAVSAALESGRLRPDGRISSGERLVLAHSSAREVYLSQADIREVQLAKAALASGIKLLLVSAGKRPADIGRVYLTGKFGAAIDPQAAVRIGLLPEVPLNSVRRHSNLALRGAVLASLDRSKRIEAEQVAGICREVVLSSHSDFEDAFVESMRLAEWR